VDVGAGFPDVATYARTDGVGRHVDLKGEHRDIEAGTRLTVPRGCEKAGRGGFLRPAPVYCDRRRRHNYSSATGGVLVDEVAELIERFRSSSPAGRALMVDELHLALPDRRAVGALIDYAADPAEDDSGRCGAFKAFHHIESEYEEDQERLRSVALRVAAADPGDMARVYAVLALGPFAAGPDVEAALIPLVTSPIGDSDVRSAAFQVLSRRGHERREALFCSLLSDPQLCREVETHFALVNQGQRRHAEPDAAPDRGGSR
jgi:hypothetical protein